MTDPEMLATARRDGNRAVVEAALGGDSSALQRASQDPATAFLLMDEAAERLIAASVAEGAIGTGEVETWRGRFQSGEFGCYVDTMAALKARRASAAGRRRPTTTTTTTAAARTPEAPAAAVGSTRPPAAATPIAMASGLEVLTLTAGAVPQAAWAAIAQITDRGQALAAIGQFKGMEPLEAEAWAAIQYAPRYPDVFDPASGDWIAGSW